MSLVCDNVTSFDVRISKDSIELDTATIKSIDRNPQIVISLGLQRMNEKRIVSRTFSTRNQLNDNITLGKSVNRLKEIRTMLLIHLRLATRYQQHR